MKKKTYFSKLLQKKNISFLLTSLVIIICGIGGIITVARFLYVRSIISDSAVNLRQKMLTVSSLEANLSEEERLLLQQVTMNSNTEETTDKLALYRLSRSWGPQGISLTLFGSGFTSENNTVHFSDRYNVTDVVSPDSTSATFIIPNFTIPAKYIIRVSNEKGKTDPGTGFYVTNKSAEPPIIHSITPEFGKYGEQITISGTGFLPTGNDISVGYEIIENIPSYDGKTIKTTIKPFAQVPELQIGRRLGLLGYEYPLGIFVANINGVSAVKIFVLKL